ncbi:MAG: ABC transporter permease [Thermodesulfobacteriota bacterium]|nr:ABC transporter permease [Thermodesulfobacteriota bacterium]
MDKKGISEKIFFRLLFPVLLALIWQIMAVYIDKPMVIPRLEAVAEVLAHPNTKILITGSLFENIVISLVRVTCGFCLAAAVSIPMGILMGYYRFAERFLESTIESLRPVPPLAWVPLVLAWFGIKSLADWFPKLSVSVVFGGVQFSMIIIILIGAFFPILLNTIHGVKSIPKIYIESAKTLGSRGLLLLFKVIIPASLPSIVTGLRIGMGIGWMCLVAAEMMPGSNAGLGYLIWYAYELLRSDIIVSGMIVIGVIGFSMDWGFRHVERNRYGWVGRMK